MCKKCNALSNTDVSTLNDWPLTSAVTWPSAWIRQTERFRSRFTLILPSHSQMPIYTRTTQWQGSLLEIDPVWTQPARELPITASGEKNVHLSDSCRKTAPALLSSFDSMFIRDIMLQIRFKIIAFEQILWNSSFSCFTVKRQIQILSSPHPFLHSFDFMFSNIWFLSQC